MINQKEKELNKQICECGHTRGQHSYIGSRRCLQVMTCNCSGFKLKVDFKKGKYIFKNIKNNIKTNEIKKLKEKKDV